ncbi:MAG: hypothetical protein ABFS16_00235 [Bacteroidota bacterium]
MGYNFYGNHTITENSNIIISDAWTRNNPSFGIINNQLTVRLRIEGCMTGLGENVGIVPGGDMRVQGVLTIPLW